MKKLALVVMLSAIPFVAAQAAELYLKLPVKFYNQLSQNSKNVIKMHVVGEKKFTVINFAKTPKYGIYNTNLKNRYNNLASNQQIVLLSLNKKYNKNNRPNIVLVGHCKPVNQKRKHGYVQYTFYNISKKGNLRHAQCQIKFFGKDK